MREEKVIPIIEASVGDRIHGIVTPFEGGGKTYRYIYGTIRAINEDTAIIFTEHEKEEEYPIEGTEVRVPLSEAEMRQKYSEGAKVVAEAFSNIVYTDHGPHDWDNSWLMADTIEELAAFFQDRDYHIVGYFPLSEPAHIRNYTHTVYDIGVVFEYEDGERFWTHGCKEYIDGMLEKYNAGIA